MAPLSCVFFSVGYSSFLVNNMPPRGEMRRTIKKQLVVAQSLLRNKRSVLDKKAVKSLEERENKLNVELAVLPPKMDISLVIERRTALQDNQPLRDIFENFWSVLAGFIEDGILSKEGYMKFHRSSHYAFVGAAATEKDSRKQEETDYLHDSCCYGELNKEAFFDIMYESVETWSTMVDPTFYAAFAWALLDSIIDTKKNPPKFRNLLDIKCFTKHKNSAGVLGNILMAVCIMLWYIDIFSFLRSLHHM